MHPFEVPGGHLPPQYSGKVMHNIGRLVAFIERSDLTVRLTHDLETAASVFRQSGEPLSVMADPAIHPHASQPDQTMALILRYKGEAVGCSVQRRVWADDLSADMKSLRYWYGQSVKPGAVSCVVAPSWLELIRNCNTVYSCGFYVAPVAQGKLKNVADALIRLAHAMTLTAWDWGWLLGRSRQGVALRYNFDVYGFEIASNGVWLLGDGADPVGHPHYLCATSRLPFMRVAAHPHYGEPAEKLSLAPLYANMPEAG
jgi:hypothetical protein